MILLQPRRTRPGVFQARGFAGTSSAQDGVDRAGRRSSHHHRHHRLHRHHRRDAGTARAPDTACSAAGRGTRPGSGAHSSKARPAQRHVILLPRGHWPMANGQWSLAAVYHRPLADATDHRRGLAGDAHPSLACSLACSRSAQSLCDGHCRVEHSKASSALGRGGHGRGLRTFRISGKKFLVGCRAGARKRDARMGNGSWEMARGKWERHARTETRAGGRALREEGDDDEPGGDGRRAQRVKVGNTTQPPSWPSPLPPVMAMSFTRCARSDHQVNPTYPVAYTAAKPSLPPIPCQSRPPHRHHHHPLTSFSPFKPSTGRLHAPQRPHRLPEAGHEGAQVRH